MNSVRLVFTPSASLVGYLEALYSQQEAEPNQVHVDTMRGIVEYFIDEVIGAFFTGPIDAIGAEGSVVNIILKGVNVIRKTGRSLALRLLERITVEDQAGLVRHFKTLNFEQDGQQYVGFPFTEKEQQQVSASFARVLAGEEVDIDALVEVFQSIADGAIGHYMDNTVAAIEVKAFSRGLVRAARATIKKSTRVAINKGIPALGGSYRRGLVAYFDERLLPMA